MRKSVHLGGLSHVMYHDAQFREGKIIFVYVEFMAHTACIDG